MCELTGPQSNGTWPDDRRPPRHPADDLAWLESGSCLVIKSHPCFSTLLAENLHSNMGSARTPPSLSGVHIS